MQWGVLDFPHLHYEGVRFVISVTRRLVVVKFPGEKRYVNRNNLMAPLV